MSERRPEDVAWAAGIFEGEGCFALAGRTIGRRTYLKVEVGMTDQDTIEKFAAVAGCGRIQVIPARKKGWKQVYRWSTAGEAAIEWADALRPWLGRRRTARLNELIAEVRQSHLSATPRPRWCRRCGSAFSVNPSRSDIHVFCSDRCRSQATHMSKLFVPGQLSL